MASAVPVGFGDFAGDPAVRHPSDPKCTYILACASLLRAGVALGAPRTLARSCHFPKEKQATKRGWGDVPPDSQSHKERLLLRRPPRHTPAPVFSLWPRLSTSSRARRLGDGVGPGGVARGWFSSFPQGFLERPARAGSVAVLGAGWLGRPGWPPCPLEPQLLHLQTADAAHSL